MIGSSLFPFSIEKDAYKHFKTRWRSLTAFDEVRVMKLFEMAQYSVIYFFLGFSIGAGLEILFPDYDEKAPIPTVIWEVLLQLVMFVVLVYYVRKIARLVPFMFVLNWDLNQDGKVSKYRPYETGEYMGEITIGLVLIASQINFLKKIDLLSREVYSKYMGLENRAGPII
jgi:hypothetical protein